MADKEAPDRNIYLSSIIRIQALLRGALVRKQIEDVKKSFEAVFQDLERNDTEQVEWESLLSVPKIGKKSARKNQQNVKSLAAGIQTKASSAQDEKKLYSVKDHDSHAEESKIVCNDEDLAKFNSVEVQTSFIDTYSKSNDDRQNLNGFPEHDTNNDNYVLEDIDTSWKDRVVPFIQNNFNDFENENGDNKVSDFHLDLNTDRESFCGQSSKSETSDKRFLKHSPRQLDSNLHQSTPGSVESNEENSNGSLEHSDKDINQYRASNRLTRLDNTSRSNSSSRQLAQVGDSISQEFQYSNRSEPRSSESKSGQSHSKRCDNFNSENDQIEKDSSSERSAQFRSANSNRSRKSERSETFNELESPKVCSSRSQTSNKSEKSDLSTVHSGISCNKSSSRRTNSGSKSGYGTSKHDRHEDSASDKSDRSVKHGQVTNRSDRSVEPEQLSNRSEKSIEYGQRSHRSDRSVERGQQSNRSERSVVHEAHSHRTQSSSEPRLHSDRSEGRSRPASVCSQKSLGQSVVEVMPPQRSSVSPVAFHSSSRADRQRVQDSTTLTNVTSVWDSFNSVRDSQAVPMPDQLPQDATSLKELRKNISMELLWVQQAIDSRKNYLKLKGKM